MLAVEFQARVNEHSRQTTDDADISQVIDELIDATKQAVQKAAEIGLAGSEITGLRERLVNTARSKWMRSRYATLDLSFIESQQRLVVGRMASDPSKIEFKRRWGQETALSKTEIVVDVPVFVCEWGSYDELRDCFREIDRSGWSRSFTFRNNNIGSIPSGKISGEYHRAVIVNVSAKMPEGINEEMFGRIRRCIAHAALFDIALFDRGLLESPRATGCEVGVLWAPNDEAWSFTAKPPRPVGDPAILVRAGDQCYLIAYYDTPDEKPIGNLIREFSDG